MSDENEVYFPTEYPRWREVMKLFIAAGFSIGDVVTHEWFYKAFELEKPNYDTPNGVAEKTRMEYLAGFTILRQVLLQDHKLDLKSLPGEGYTIIAPGEQTGEAYGDGIKEMRRALRRMARRIVCIKLEELTDNQRRENAEAMAKLAMLRGMVRKTNRLSGPQVEEE